MIAFSRLKFCLHSFTKVFFILDYRINVFKIKSVNANILFCSVALRNEVAYYTYFLLFPENKVAKNFDFGLVGFEAFRILLPGVILPALGDLLFSRVM